VAIEFRGGIRDGGSVLSLGFCPVHGGSAGPQGGAGGGCGAAQREERGHGVQ
jgi:hypothetical protein